MEQSRRCAGHSPVPELGDVALLDDVRAELGEIEALDRQIGDLTALLQARLAPEEFRLVWALRDAVERLAVAEALLRERRLADELARLLPGCSAAMQAMRQHILGDEQAIDETG
jgi:hypothetical protein